MMPPKPGVEAKSPQSTTLEVEKSVGNQSDRGVNKRFETNVPIDESKDVFMAYRNQIKVEAQIQK